MSVELDKIIRFIQISANGLFVDKMLYQSDESFQPTLIVSGRSCLPSKKFNLDMISLQGKIVMLIINLRAKYCMK
jgi:hypothetical protein